MLSKQIGDAFEGLVLKDLEERGFDFISRNVYMKGTGCEVDFLARNTDKIWHVEAKGGYYGNKKRPGAKRTDNVKAVASASLIKAVYPEVYFVAYFSAMANPNSYSSEMISTALKHKIFDEVIYLYAGEE
jgi:Holliday junction resolvase-like predicted endonuclease